MSNDNADSEFLQKRLDMISEGLKEGIRREVQRLREQGLPVYVAHNGKVVRQPSASPTTKPKS